MEHLKYPIGKFNCPTIIDHDCINLWIESIKSFPRLLSKEVELISPQELQNTYRPGGWTIIQIVNHCADSHMNSFIRFKLALTEVRPTIKPYQEELWAELPDAKNFEIISSLKILEGLHNRWTHLLINLTDQDLDREYIHPSSIEPIKLNVAIGMYAWHCNHHLAHIINAKGMHI